jgi:hypothetical protein
MSSRPLFRFVHASNLELDRFCAVEGELRHDQLRMLVDAPFRAAERVFETALQEEAELILLAGGVFAGVRPSTWGASFLARQCERVGREGITVYWAEGSPERLNAWPRFLPFPRNLLLGDPLTRRRSALITSGLVPVELICHGDPLELRRSTLPLCASDVLPPFAIGIQPRRTEGPSDPGETSSASDVDYRAVQGTGQATTFAAARGMVRSAGTTQPRNRHEGSVGGCLVVEVGRQYALGTRFVETNSLRFHNQSLVVNDSLNWEGFRRLVHARTDDVLQQTTADAVAFHWQIEGHGPVLERLIRPAAAREIEQELQHTYGKRRPTAWVADFAVSPDAVWEARWQRDAGPFGTFVRTLESLPTEAAEIDLAALVEAQAGAPAADPADQKVSRPHFQTVVKSAARRHAADILANFPR